MSSHDTLENAPAEIPASWSATRRPVGGAVVQPELEAHGQAHGHDCDGGEGHDCSHGEAPGSDDPAKGGRARAGEPAEPDLPPINERSAPLIENPRPVEPASIDGVPLQA